MTKASLNLGMVVAVVFLIAGMPGLTRTARAEGDSYLTHEPIPLQTEAYALIAVDDVASFEGLLQKLQAAMDQPDSPAGRVWELLSPKLRGELKSIDAAAPLDERVKFRMVTGLNDVLRRPNFYTAEAFASVAVPDELKAELEAGVDKLGPVEGTARNRELLRLSFPDELLVTQVKPYPIRPKTIVLFGDDFLNTGNIKPGYKIPTGAVWQPSLMIYGTYRSAWQWEDSGRRPAPIQAAGGPVQRDMFEIEQWVNRLDLFFNLALTPTERIVANVRPFDQDGNWSGYTWEDANPSDSDGWDIEGDFRLEQLYFEGDFGELFPRLDPKDTGVLDIGFSVGRQPLFFQEGIMLNDNIDAIGITRNNVLIPWGSNLRITGLWGWDNVNRGVGAGVNTRNDDAHLFGLFTNWDFPKTTVDFDIAYINEDEERVRLANNTFRMEGGDQLNLGLSLTRRILHVNTSLRLNTSMAIGDETIHAQDGTLIFGEASWSPPGTNDLLYGTAFWAIDEYLSISRDATAGGPLARAGILYEAFGIGNLDGSPIENTSVESVGGAIGYQKFFSDTRKQVILEVGGRTDTDGTDRGRLGVMARYQQAIKNRFVWRVDAYFVQRENLADKRGLRTEFVVQF
ncbi:MAG: hypothetical protein HYV27_06550 [Candidatus Hydrogenedentes bacterium]|nr:hypothetical protein [Candidatus Hydrogenedentota bacterium]